MNIWKLYQPETMSLIDTGKNVQKWTQVFSTRRWVKLVARTRRKKEKKIACPLLDVFAYGQVSSLRLYRLTRILDKTIDKFRTLFNAYLGRIVDSDILFSRVWLALSTEWTLKLSQPFNFDPKFVSSIQFESGDWEDLWSVYCPYFWS